MLFQFRCICFIIPVTSLLIVLGFIVVQVSLASYSYKMISAPKLAANDIFIKSIIPLPNQSFCMRKNPSMSLMTRIPSKIHAALTISKWDAHFVTYINHIHYCLYHNSVRACRIRVGVLTQSFIGWKVEYLAKNSYMSTEHLSQSIQAN